MRNRPQRNNNPLNLRFANQAEAIGRDKDGFAIFPWPEAGWRAGHAEIRLETKRGLNLEQLIRQWAPPSENKTSEYLGFICRELGVEPGTRLSAISEYALAGVMAQMEGAFQINPT